MCGYENGVNWVEMNVGDMMEERLKGEMVVWWFDIVFEMMNGGFVGSGGKGEGDG